MDQLKSGLEASLKSKNYVRDEKQMLAEEVAEFLTLYPKATHDVADTYKKIPKFFKPVSSQLLCHFKHRHRANAFKFI